MYQQNQHGHKWTSTFCKGTANITTTRMSPWKVQTPWMWCHMHLQAGEQTVIWRCKVWFASYLTFNAEVQLTPNTLLQFSYVRQHNPHVAQWLRLSWYIQSWLTYTARQRQAQLQPCITSNFSLSNSYIRWTAYCPCQMHSKDSLVVSYEKRSANPGKCRFSVIQTKTLAWDLSGV